MKGSGTSRLPKPALKSGGRRRDEKKLQPQQRYARRMTIAEIKAGEAKAVADGLIRRPEVNHPSQDPLHGLSLSFTGDILSGLDSSSYVGHGNPNNITGLGHTNGLMPVGNSWVVNPQLNSTEQNINWIPNIAPPPFGNFDALPYPVAPVNNMGILSELPFPPLQNSQAMNAMAQDGPYASGPLLYNGYQRYETPESVTTAAAGHVFDHLTVGYATSITDSVPQPSEIPTLNAPHHPAFECNVYPLNPVPEGPEYNQATESSNLQLQHNLLENYQPGTDRDPSAFHFSLE